MTPILIVDDEAPIRAVISRWLEQSGLQARTADSAEAAMKAMAEEPASVAICDIAMAGQGGIWLIRELRAKYPHTGVVVATGVDALPPDVTLRSGIAAYLLKPLRPAELLHAVRDALAWHQRAIDAERWRDQLETERGERAALLDGMLEGVSAQSVDDVGAVLSSVLADTAALEHASRVASLATAVARALCVVEPELSHIRSAALLHDIGKLAVPTALLRKPAALTSHERAILRRYPEEGAAIVRRVPFLEPAAAIIAAVQEKFDGLGYPRGLCDAEIPLGSRIIAAADAYDTMTHARPYRQAMAGADAILELGRCAGSQFDPMVVEVLTGVIASAELATAASDAQPVSPPS
jgi:putative nucleotidyltransferase with HDIG domain